MSGTAKTSAIDAALEIAGRFLAAFDPLSALRLVALREEPLALALRGVAMAQLGDYRAARRLLERAAKGLAGASPLAHARCLAALGEVELARRDPLAARRSLASARAALERAGDRINASFVALLEVRCRLLTGEVDAARALLSTVGPRGAPPRLVVLAALAAADIAVRRTDAAGAARAIERARVASRIACLPVLDAEVERAARDLAAPVARSVRGGLETTCDLASVDALLRSEALVVDVCRRLVRVRETVATLVRRPVLLAIAELLACAHPASVSRGRLAGRAFGVRRMSDSVRVRLRVEVGRLRRAIRDLADIDATGDGYVLRPRGREVVALLPPAEGEANAILALLRGGESWTTSSLAEATGKSRRTVQRALAALLEAGTIEGLGAGRARRWVARPPDGFATTLLLVVRGGRE